MQKTFFEKRATIILVIINVVFLALAYFVLDLKVFQDGEGREKYSVIDKAVYGLRCGGERHIKLRENAPYQDSYRIPPYDNKEKYSFRTDENGFIKPGKVHENPDVNIFFLGGSTTECEHVKELERFPYLTGRILEKQTGKKINAYNAGKSGNNSIHSINNLVNKIVPLRPNIVVLMHNINDLSTLLYEATYWNENKSRSNLSCFSKSKENLRSFKNEWENSPFARKIPDNNHKNQIEVEHRRILRLFIAIVRGIGAEPVLMTQSNEIENNPNFSLDRSDALSKPYQTLYTNFNNNIRQVAKQEAVLLVDLAREVKDGKKYLYDSVHFNNEGSKMAATVIAQKLNKIIRR